MNEFVGKEIGERIPVNKKASLFINGDFKKGKIINLSKGGIGFELDEPLIDAVEIGSKIAIVIDSSSEGLHGQNEVFRVVLSWCREEARRKIGLKFVNDDALVFQNIFNKKEVVKSSTLNELSLYIKSKMHDLNNCLSGIFGHAGLLETLPLGDEASVYTNEIIRSADTMANIIKDVQKFFRNNNYPVSVTVEEIFKILEKSNVQIRMTNQKNITPFLVQQEILVEAISQIVQNAKKYSKIIDISFSEIYRDDERYIKICIEDQGGGIADEYISRIFEPKFTTRENGSGGFGLFYAQEIINSLGGEILVENVKKDGKRIGAKFSVIFPDKATKTA